MGFVGLVLSFLRVLPVFLEFRAGTRKAVIRVVPCIRTCVSSIRAMSWGSHKFMSTAFRLGLIAVFTVLLFSCLSLSAFGQDGPRYEVFGGYSYWRFDSAPLAFRDRPSMNGGTASAAFNLTPNIGVVGQIGGGWSDLLKSYDAAIGPQLSWRRGRMTSCQVRLSKVKV